MNCQQLEELSLNGAPVAAHPGYHPLLYRLKRLKLLDGMHVSTYLLTNSISDTQHSLWRERF